MMCGGLFSFCFLHETVFGNGQVAITHNYRVEIKFVGGQFVGYNKNYSITETQNRNWLSWVIIGDIFNNPELIA